MSKKQPNYTAEMEARIAEMAKKHDGLDLALCTELAEEPMFIKAEKTARAIVAKARSMGVAYRKQERTDKTGAPVVRKDELAAEIGAMLGLSKDEYESLSKAEKPTLKALYSAVAGLTAPKSAAAA